jgi:hypothetical protein
MLGGSDMIAAEMEEVVDLMWAESVFPHRGGIPPLKSHNV